MHKHTKEEQAVIGRAMMDPDFRMRLLTDPEGTLKAEKLTVSPALLKELKGLDRNVAEQVGRIIGAMFGQKEPPPLSEEQLGAVSGGATIQQISAAQPIDINYVMKPGIGGIQPPARAPTTW